MLRPVISAVGDNADGIALGNVVGSNTANILLVLGIPALMRALHTSECDTRKNYVFMLMASVLFIALAFLGEFTVTSGLILLAALAFVLGVAFREARAHRKNGKDSDLDDIEEADPDMPYWRIGIYLLLGLIGLPLGADLLVDNASIIARMYGVTDTVMHNSEFKVDLTSDLGLDQLPDLTEHKRKARSFNTRLADGLASVGLNPDPTRP